MKHLHVRSSASRRRSGGFTLIEVLVTVAIAAVLAGIAYPSFRDQIVRARRHDAIASLITVQMAQERWRANQATYGSLADLGVPGASGAGHYALQVVSSTATGYQILATARGNQGRDADCRNLRLDMVGANFVYASGPDDTVANPAPTNRRCWSL